MDVCCEEKLHNKQDDVDEAWRAYLRIIKNVKEQKLKEIQNKSNQLKQLKIKIWNAVDNSFEHNSSTVAKVKYELNSIDVL